VECCGSLLGQIRSKTEAGSTLLDKTSVLFGCNPGNASAHPTRNLPIFLAGGGFRHGRYIACPEKTPLCNLFATLLNSLSIGHEAFGQSTGTLSLPTSAPQLPEQGCNAGQRLRR